MRKDLTERLEALRVTPDPDMWRHLEAEFASVLGEVPKPKGPEKAKEAREE